MSRDFTEPSNRRNPPSGGVLSVDPYVGRYRDAKGGSELMYDELMRRLPHELSDRFQIIVSRVREFLPGKKAILWCQDPWCARESKHLALPESRQRFKKIVFVSNYQFTTYYQGLGVPYSESVVLGNAIVPIATTLPPKPDDTIRLVYHSMPDRGLELLLPVFIRLAQQRPKLHLDVYSSFRLYGQDRRDTRYEPLFNICRTHPQISYHGAVPNDHIREALKRTHIFAYPCSVFETFCIAAVEAMSAGCLVVCPDVAALAETVSTHGLVYRWTENSEVHKERFAAALVSAIDMTEKATAVDLLTSAQRRVMRRYNWATRIVEWTRMLEGILDGDGSAPAGERRKHVPARS